MEQVGRRFSKEQSMACCTEKQCSRLLPERIAPPKAAIFHTRDEHVDSRTGNTSNGTRALTSEEPHLSQMQFTAAMVSQPPCTGASIVRTSDLQLSCERNQSACRTRRKDGQIHHSTLTQPNRSRAPDQPHLRFQLTLLRLRSLGHVS